MTIKMKPVCDCGYVFRKFACVTKVSETNSGDNTPKAVDITFYPNMCPNCCEIIDSLHITVPDNTGNFTYNEQNATEEVVVNE